MIDEVDTLSDWLIKQGLKSRSARRVITETDIKEIKVALQSCGIYEVANKLGFSYGTVKRIAEGL